MASKLFGGSAGDIAINEPDQAEMIWVPRGYFRMGTNQVPYPTEISRNQTNTFCAPIHTIKIGDGFWLYRTPVTNEQFSRFLSANPTRKPPKHWDNPRFHHDQQPVVGLTWDDIEVYCEWAGATLPTEAQWEYAARGGSDERDFPWGSNEPDASLATYGGDSFDGVPATVNACLKGISWCGAIDMSGNIWETCYDVYGHDLNRFHQNNSAYIDPLKISDLIALRGGFYAGSASDMKVWNRIGGYPINSKSHNRDFVANLIFSILVATDSIFIWDVCATNTGFRPIKTGYSSGYKILDRNVFTTDEATDGQKNASAIYNVRGAKEKSMSTKKRVFVVYGHDGAALSLVEGVLHRLECDPVVFGRLRNRIGKTTIEILEEELPNVDAVVVLLTPDDEGRKIGDPALEPRARQNVLIEAGYAVISRRKSSLIIALGNVSIPSDFDGIQRVPLQNIDRGGELIIAEHLRDILSI